MVDINVKEEIDKYVAQRKVIIERIRELEYERAQLNTIVERLNGIIEYLNSFGGDVDAE